LVHSTFSQSRQGKIQESFLTRAHVITDWMEPAARVDQGDPDSDCDERFVSALHFILENPNHNSHRVPYFFCHIIVNFLLLCHNLLLFVSLVNI